MPLTTSHGVFTSSRAFRNVSQSDINRLYFNSDKEENFAGRMLSEADRSDSLHHVLEMGHKDTKYLKKRLRTAPAMDRTCSRYYGDYFAKTLAERGFNAGLADSYRKINGDSSYSLAPSFSTGTLYHETFDGHSPEKMRESKPPPQGYSRALTQTLTSSEENYEVLSQAHRLHSGQVQTPRAKEQPPDLILLPGSVVGDSYRTTYSRKHTNSAADVSASRYFSSTVSSADLGASFGGFGLTRASTAGSPCRPRASSACGSRRRSTSSS
uniref:Uncharacterized protein n=1 Tax=Alexandrium andersonii TaxID=327968 RepID=A0A7S2ID77_9DINO|mmetsp:Transcript_82137/g.183463  ORF Transcript_82137/g.183463 Transcript_82137/m.183463 type:complete len:268 (+) Transcript_82137:39-842(+)